MAEWQFNPANAGYNHGYGEEGSVGVSTQLSCRDSYANISRVCEVNQS